MDAGLLTEALKFALHNKEQVTELTVRFTDERSVVGYLSKVSSGDVTLTEEGAVPLAGRDHKIEPALVVSVQFGLSDGSFRNF